MLNHSEFSKAYHFRAITRDTSKPAAEKLKEKGVEVVQVRRGPLFIYYPF
jgi:hypothetical protein